MVRASRASKNFGLAELDPISLYKIQKCSLLKPQTSLQPRDPYSQEELRRLYPEGLELQLVQIVSLLYLSFSVV